ncbi:MAG: serine hydrolase [Polyangiales bacterium]|nr:serine hydrolase [Myxococcales bacterium]MCB9656796.1 serine hydrolase [Sandaracinaceae bacterium]
MNALRPHAAFLTFALLSGLLGSCASDAPFEFAEGTPADVDMDAAVLEGARAYAFAPGRNTQGVVVVRRGTIVAEWYADQRDAASRAASWSVGKSFASALVGIALDRGDIPSLDEPITTYIPEWVGTEKEGMRLRDVMEMASGLDWNEDYDPAEAGASDVIDLVLDQSGSLLSVVLDNPVVAAPGTRFNYSSGDAMLVSRVIRVATGVPAHEYAREHLFEPMGVSDAAWWRDVEGDTLTFCCVDMPTRDFARFGQLFLNGGWLGGRRILSERWVADSIAPSRSYEGYGYMWWLTGNTRDDVPDDLFSARGHDGQYIYVIPSLELVVVRNGWYAPYLGDTVADPSLFGRYPSDGIIPSRGTRPPNEWDDAAFLAPIVDSIRDAP